MAIKPTWTPPTLETERLILRAITLDDAPALFEYAQNEKVAQYVIWPAHQTIQDSIDYIQNYAFDKYSKFEPDSFAITLKSNPQKMIGTVGLFWASKNDHVMEMGYALSEEYWNQGIVSEAAKRVAQYGFEDYSKNIAPINRIQAHCRVENVGSAKVMEKIGMKYEATHHERRFDKGRYWDFMVYAMLKKDLKRD